MGKKSKLYKSGLPRNQIKKSSNKVIHKLPQNMKISSTQNQTHIEPSKANNIKIIPEVNYNLDALKKANETLGLSEDQIRSLYIRPLRNRRFIHNLTLTKREKKKEMRKMKKEMKQKMEDRTKLDITLNPNLHFRNNLEKDISQINMKKEDKKNKINKTTMGFDFGEMNGLIDDMVEDEGNKISQNNKSNNSSMRNKNQRKMIYNEANEIGNILNNKEFLENPNLVLKRQIQEQQKIKERNDKIRQEFNEKYNFLNIK